MTESMIDRYECVGPKVGRCPEITDDGRCPGAVFAVDQTGPIWTVCCDTCSYEVGAPARNFDPEISRWQLLERAELPARFVNTKIEEDGDNKSALFAIRGWLADVDKGESLPAPALYGLPGRGKTLALVALCRRLIERDTPVLFRPIRTLLRELQKFEDPAERGKAWERAVSVDVLALDDLGAEQITDWRLDQVADLIDQRYMNERPILVATNYPPKMWREVMDARTASRLDGMTLKIELRGPDRRQQALATQTGEVSP